MRLAALLLAAGVPALAAAQGPAGKDAAISIEVTGCVKGSILTETNLRMAEGARDDGPARRWRVRGPKALLKQIKANTGKELAIAGKSKTLDSGIAMGGARIGRTNIFIGGAGPQGSQPSRDPVPEPPTLDVESFTTTGETCR